MTGLLFNEKQYQPQTVRGYQEDAIQAVQDAWSRGVAGPLVASATGSGKTTIISELLRRMVKPSQQRAILIAHTEEIITQMRDRVANQFNGALDERYTERAAPGIGIVMADEDAADARLLIATRQSLHPKRLDRVLLHGKIDYIVIDEAHHAGPGTTYLDIVQTIRAHNPSVRIVGFTATPNRTDGLALGALWTEIVFEWLIPDGIKQGYLVPPTRQRITTEVNLSGVQNVGGDYNAKRMVSVLGASNWAELAYKAYMDYIAPKDRLTLAFFPSVEMSREFAAHLRERNIPAAHLDGNTDKDTRRKMLQDYKARRIKVLSNYGVLTEGFDAPETSAILMARPTRSSTLFTQIIGRGLRPFPGKTDCLIVDLAVTDVRALETGTLIGKMTICKECGIEHFAGLRACPQCGYVRGWKERARDGAPVDVDEGDYEGERLIANYEAVFTNAFAAWYAGEDGFYSCTLSFEDGAYIIVPPLTDNEYRLALVPKDKDKRTQFVLRNEDLSSLMLDADQRVKARGFASSDKNAAWRELPPTEAQIKLLGKMGVKPAVLQGISRGSASQLITHHIAVRRLTQES